MSKPLSPQPTQGDAMSMRLCLALFLASLGLTGCISSSSPPPPATNTVVVPEGSTVVCPSGYAPPCS